MAPFPNNSDDSIGFYAKRNIFLGCLRNLLLAHKRQRAREQYLTFAKAALRENRGSYQALFEEYANDQPETQQTAAQDLDQTVTKVAVQCMSWIC
ncbi:MAG: hypothetical protein AAFV72_01195 [Cyanobacteria bacterium J06635_1]